MERGEERRVGREGGRGEGREGRGLLNAIGVSIACCFPLCSSAMDLSLVPSSLSMSTRLVQQTGMGERQGEEEEVESDTLWRYSIPPVARNEYWYTGSASDDTAPVFSSPLPNVTDSLCTVRQLPWRHHDNPAFELDFQVCDAESVSNISLEVTAVESGAVLIQSTPLRGLRFNGPYAFPLGESIRFTLTAANSEGLSSTTSCELPFYDQTPPLARITPRRSTSSHPSQLEALFSLFGLFELSEIQEVAVGTRAGPQGHDIMEWKEFRADLLSTPPPGASFSFGRVGSQLCGHYAQHTDMSLELCIRYHSCSHILLLILKLTYSLPQPTHVHFRSPSKLLLSSPSSSPGWTTDDEYN